MKANKLFAIVMAVAMVFSLTACGHEHTWADANCTTPKTCSDCGETEGESLGHIWADATCAAPKTCSVCKATEGKVAGHKWLEATTEAPKTCSVCKATTGSKLKTDSRFRTKAPKELQGTWKCDVVLTDEMMDLPGFGNAECTFILTFGNTGELSQKVQVKDEKDFMTKFKLYTVQVTYEDFAHEGFSREESDQAMLNAYGLNVPDYVDAMLKGYDINSLFKWYTAEEVYYVENGNIYTALSWKANFDKSAYTLNNGKLVIDGLSLEEGGTPLTWKKA